MATNTLGAVDMSQIVKDCVDPCNLEIKVRDVN